MNIITKKLTQDMIIKRNIQGMFKEHPTCKNSNIVTIQEENNIELGYAIVTPQNNFNSEEIFKKNLIGLLEYDKEEYRQLYLKYKDFLNKSSYLNYIEVYKQNKGFGRILLNYLMKEYKNIYLYSIIESEYFWENNNFIEISEGDHNYIISNQ